MPLVDVIADNHAVRFLSLMLVRNQTNRLLLWFACRLPVRFNRLNRLNRHNPNGPQLGKAAPACYSVANFKCNVEGFLALNILFNYRKKAFLLRSESCRSRFSQSHSRARAAER